MKSGDSVQVLASKAAGYSFAVRLDHDWGNFSAAGLRHAYIEFLSQPLFEADLETFRQRIAAADRRPAPQSADPDDWFTA